MADAETTSALSSRAGRAEMPSNRALAASPPVRRYQRTRLGGSMTVRTETGAD